MVKYNIVIVIVIVIDIYRIAFVSLREFVYFPWSIDQVVEVAIPQC